MHVKKRTTAMRTVQRRPPRRVEDSMCAAVVGRRCLRSFFGRGTLSCFGRGTPRGCLAGAVAG